MKVLTKLVVLCGFALLSACGPAAIPDGIDDPFEAQNRKAHEGQVRSDTRILRPAANAYGESVPQPVRRGLANFSANLTLPRSVVNGVLQARPDTATHNLLRFVVNTTVGIGGLFDPATKIGLDDRSTDFGETLHVWGVGEGHYLEAPLIGPTTERDAVGKVVDVALNPLVYVINAQQAAGILVLKGLSGLNYRYNYRSTVDSILHDSADSYAQTRSIYLQNRRHQLRQYGRLGADGSDDYVDPYEDDAAAATGGSSDAYDDYFDPYEEIQ